MGDPREHRRIGNLVAIQVQDGQNGTVRDRVQKLVRVPRSGKGTGLGLTVPHHASHDEVGVVKGRSIRVRDSVPELTPLVDGARRFRSHVAGDPAGERELLEQLLHPLFILGNVGVILAIRPLQVRVGHYPGTPVTGAGNVDHVQVILLDHVVQVHVDEVQPRRGPPVSQQAGFNVFQLEGFLE